ncbi:hypothetical protein V0U79_06145 [Hyphobacterium sp. HN65]|uniref:Uncharacterized protein n=1 Tax=Hyphobacterium lacteum TaxID=3116575 RepID=A0ABU7LPU6_9PROT|nr:hypothetical protein [Hyphobacterium sp. HN65]MEE2525940.1 hypothetical protein [Hyphobacterium sp. HN65]
MILSRLSHAFRTQNWFAVALEFIIVIAGVVIGFQVTQWADERSDAAHRAVALDRLHGEVVNAVGILTWMVANYDEINTSRTEVIERIIAGDLDGIDTDENRSGAVAVSLLPAFSPRQGVYTEIVSSGMLSNLGDEAFRDALGEYQSGVVFLQGQIDYFRTITATDADVTEFDYVWLEYAPGTTRERRFVIDWNAAAADPEFLQYLLAANNRMRAMQGWWDNTLSLARDLCAETGRLTGQACEQPGDPFE